MRWLALLLLSLTLSTGCSYKRKIKNLSDAEFDHYYALRVYMEEDARKEYFKLKTEDKRNQWLKDQGLWDRFYQYPDHIRQKIIEGAVQVGWTKDQVYMAWGIPIDRRKLPGRKAERSELLVYKFEAHVDKDGTRSVMLWEPGSKTAYKAERFFLRELTLDDDVVAEIAEKDTAG